MRRIYLDFETRSATELTGAGVYRYTEDEQFAPLILTWCQGHGEVEHTEDVAVMRELLEGWLADPQVVLVAHNASFDRIIASTLVYGTKSHRYLDPRRWDDTLPRAAESGLPKSLKHLAVALGAPEKDEAGMRLINLFSKPQRSRSAPEETFWADAESHPRPWAEFIAYAIQDTATLREVDALLAPWPSAEERELWIETEIMNDRGILIDTELAQGAVQAAARNATEAGAELEALLGIDNANSVVQVREALWDRGLGVMDLRADSVTQWLASDLPDAEERRALELRETLAGSATKKYAAMLRSVCSDGRVRGTLRFFGAHTGRYAGSIIQVQNFPRAKAASDAEEETIITAVKSGEPVSGGDLKRVLRPTLMGDPGLLVSDLGQIEARVAAWIAGEQWMLDAFAQGRDLYTEVAQRMGSQFTRQDGKVACIAEGELVTTHRGLVPIESVRIDDLVWDGLEWVSHDGVVLKGEKEVIEYDGLRATPDHLVWVEGSETPVRFDAAQRERKAIQRSEPAWTAEGLAGDRGKVRTYDLLNAGPRHRFTVSGRLVHNCLAQNYQGWVGALRAMGGRGTDEELAKLAGAYRDSIPNIVATWAKAERAFKHGGRIGEHVRVEKDGNDRHLRLPSGRSLVYHEVGYRGGELTYLDYARRGGVMGIYGGKVFQQTTQAIARDFIAISMLTCAEYGIRVVSMVHDEIVAEGPRSDLDLLTQIMVTPPPWAPGIPLTSDSYARRRYTKG